MLHYCLISAVCLVVSAAERDAAGATATHNGRLKHYRQVLENYGIDGSATGANQFLLSLLPDQNSSREIQTLIGQLSSPTYRQREVAEKRLATKGPAALMQLKVASDQGDTETRCRAQRCMATIDATHRQLLAAALEVLVLDPSEKPRKRDRLITVLRLLRENKAQSKPLTRLPMQLADSTCRDEIRDGIKDLDRDVRIACTLALPSSFSKEQLQAFSKLIESEDPRIANAAIESLGNLQPDLALQRLIIHLDHDDVDVRKQAAVLLRTISRNYFGFHSEGDQSARRKAIRKWQAWVDRNSPLDASLFKNLLSQEAADPKGFLISVSGRSVHQLQSGWPADLET